MYSRQMVKTDYTTVTCYNKCITSYLILVSRAPLPKSTEKGSISMMTTLPIFFIFHQKLIFNSSNRRVGKTMDLINAQGQRRRQVRPDGRKVLRRRRTEQGHSDEPGRKVLRFVGRVQAVLEQGQAAGPPVHRQARAEHRLRRRIRQAVRLLPRR